MAFLVMGLFFLFILKSIRICLYNTVGLFFLALFSSVAYNNYTIFGNLYVLKLKTIKAKILTISIFLILTLQVNAQNILDQTIEKDYTGYLITDVFVELENEFNICFFYKSNWIDSVRVTKLPPNISLRQFLNTTLKNNQLSYIDIQGTNFVLVPDGYNLIQELGEHNYIKQIGNPLEKGKNAINLVEGFVNYGKTGDPIVGAIVYNRQYNKQTVSDYNGHYAISLPGGVTKLDFSFIGLETNSIDIEVFSNGNLNCELFEKAVQIEAINVSAYSGKNNVERTQMGVVHVEMKNLSKLPVLMGETDIIKGMTLLPGVQSTGELSSGFNVRGGNVDQNQVLVGGAPLFNTAHLFGLFSTLIPDVVSDVEFHKGTQTANYGGRLSSVMDIKIKNPDPDKIKGKAGIGILNSNLFVEGPIVKDFITFSVGGRTTYSNWILKKIPDIDIRESEANFYDLIGNVNLKLNDKNQIKVFAYYSSDYFKYSYKNKYAYNSFLGALKYQLLLSDFSSVNFNISYTDYTNDLAFIEDPILASTVQTGIKQLLGKAELNLQLNQHTILLGVEGKNYNITPGVKNKYGADSKVFAEQIDNEKALELAGFIQDNYAISDRFSIMAGLRYSWYSKYGSSISYMYDANKSVSDNSVIDSIFYGAGEMVKPYFGFEPRLGVKYSFSEMSSLKAGYHISRQYQHLISNSSSATPSDYWKSADMNIKPMLSQQYSVGYFRNFFNNNVETSAELYYKTISNTLDYRNGAVLVMNQHIERDVIAGDSKSYGLELMIKKNSGKLNGWLSYTLSKSLIRIDGNFEDDKINNGVYFSTYNDRLHDLSLSVNYQITRRWNVASNFILSSGRPTTFPEKKYVYRGKEVVFFSERNKYNLPAYHRLDLAITYEGFLKKTKLVHPSFTFSVYNLYGHRNIYSVYYKNDIPSSLNNYSWYGLYQLSIIGIPIPSFTINLRF